MINQQPETFEKVITSYGGGNSKASTFISYRTAKKLAQQIVGTLGIQAAWIEPLDVDHPERGGHVIALCQVMPGVHHLPYRKPMEYK